MKGFPSIATQLIALTSVAHAFVTRTSSLTRPLSPPRAVSSALAASTPGADFEFALLFDCDGVILETEELHRVAYNAAFDEFKLTIDGEPVNWSVRAVLL